jgi:hypothetical protein
MSKFHSALQRAYRTIITEQEQPPIDPNAAVPAPPQGVAPEQAAPTPIPEVPEEQGVEQIEKLSPEGMVFLVRLLAKALMIERLDPDEEKKIVDFGDINENNAKEALKNLMPIIQHYTPSLEDMPRF